MENNAKNFEALVARILEGAGYSILSREPGFNGKRFDLLIENGGARHVVEIKYYSDGRLPIGRLRDVASMLATYQDIEKFVSKPILITNAYLPAAKINWIQEYYPLEVWSRDTLRRHATKLGIMAELEPFLYNKQPTEAQIAPLLHDNKKGKELLQKLTALEPGGGKKASAYEGLCVEIIDFLFEDSLKEPLTQNSTIDGLNRFDVVYRLAFECKNFWDRLCRDFRSRTIMFECKNYADEVGAGQVYTTERYLHKNALRTICFVLCRNGVQKQFYQAAYGTLRETGKLILPLTDKHLEEMIKLKSIDEDPTTIVDIELYRFLAAAER